MLQQFACSRIRSLIVCKVSRHVSGFRMIIGSCHKLRAYPACFPASPHTPGSISLLHTFQFVHHLVPNTAYVQSCLLHHVSTNSQSPGTRVHSNTHSEPSVSHKTTFRPCQHLKQETLILTSMSLSSSTSSSLYSSWNGSLLFACLVFWTASYFSYLVTHGEQTVDMLEHPGRACHECSSCTAILYFHCFRPVHGPYQPKQANIVGSVRPFRNHTAECRLAFWFTL